MYISGWLTDSKCPEVLINSKTLNKIYFMDRVQHDLKIGLFVTINVHRNSFRRVYTIHCIGIHKNRVSQVSDTFFFNELCFSESS